MNIRFNLNEMLLGTFHSVCLRLLEDYREYTRLKRSYTLLDQFDQQYFLYQKISEFRSLPDAQLVMGDDQKSRWAQSDELLKWLNKVSEEALDDGRIVRPRASLLFLDCFLIYSGRTRGLGFLDQMLRNSSRGRGRPRSFDESEALDKATQIFWSKSYDGVAIDDLIAGMGVGRQSLYSVFGDKRTLFLRVLRTYAERKGAGAAKALFSPPALRDAIAGFLRHAVEVATEQGSVRGCLMVCVAPLVDDAEVRQFLKDAAAGGVALVERRFRDGISAGEIPSDFPVTTRARQVIDLARGLTMHAQLGAPRKTLLKDAEEAAELVLLSRRDEVPSKY